jgi:hypothetical protein
VGDGEALVSSIPGIDSRAPERTDTSSGSEASPSRFRSHRKWLASLSENRKTALWRRL